MKWFKRILLIIAILLTGVLAVLGASYYLMKGIPEWYHPRHQTAQQRDIAARSAEQKLADVQNWAADAHAAEIRARSGRPTTTATSATVTFTEDELNAFFYKWAEFYHFQDRYGQYLSEPVLVLQDNRLILAAQAQKLDAVVSFHFEPSIDEQGRLHLKLVRVLAGRLPMPDALWSSQKSRLERSIKAHLPHWQLDANIDPAGIANDDAVMAGMGKLILHLLNNQPSQAVIFLPIIQNAGIRKVPVRLLDVSIAPHALTLTVDRLTSSERTEYLQQLRQADPLQATLAVITPIPKTRTHPD
ncbi:MAG: hypothetical protein IT446_15430 [Phycisphaerales bacterium]|nr:hypothetical protein [Phycisphaerales bacterium]